MTDPRMTPTNDARVTVEQCDREAAYLYWLFTRSLDEADYRAKLMQTEFEKGARDEQETVQAFARHRLAALASAPAGDAFADAGKPIAPAGDGVDDREVARMREVARDWRRPSLAQIEGPGDLKIYGGTIADDIDRWADMLAASLNRPALDQGADDDAKARDVLYRHLETATGYLAYDIREIIDDNPDVTSHVSCGVVQAILNAMQEYAALARPRAAVGEVPCWSRRMTEEEACELVGFEPDTILTCLREWGYVEDTALQSPPAKE